MYNQKCKFPPDRMSKGICLFDYLWDGNYDIAQKRLSGIRIKIGKTVFDSRKISRCL